ncbi:MAG: IS3 family transposase [Paracoccaceae bacterium]
MIAKLAFIAAHIRNHSVWLLCRIPRISRSWFHAWQRTAPERAAWAARHEALISEIKSIFDKSTQRYGALRIYVELRDRERHVSRKLTAKLMKENNIRPPRRSRRMLMTTDSRHGDDIAPRMQDRTWISQRPTLSGLSTPLHMSCQLTAY